MATKHRGEGVGGQLLVPACDENTQVLRAGPWLQGACPRRAYTGACLSRLVPAPSLQAAPHSRLPGSRNSHPGAAEASVLQIRSPHTSILPLQILNQPPPRIPGECHARVRSPAVLDKPFLYLGTPQESLLHPVMPPRGQELPRACLHPSPNAHPEAPLPLASCRGAPTLLSG